MTGEETFHFPHRGCEEGCIWATGKFLKELSSSEGYPILHDTDGQPLLDERWYIVNEKGIWLYQTGADNQPSKAT